MKAKKAKDFVEELINDVLGSGDESSKEANDRTMPIDLSVHKSEVASQADISSESDHSEETKRSGQDPTRKFTPDASTADDLSFKSTRNMAQSDANKNIRTAVGGKFAVKPGMSSSGLGTHAALIQSENLRVAQEKIFELEQEIERLRTNNEQLAAAGETIRRRADELQTENEHKTKKLSDLQEQLAGEKEILESSLKAKEREVKDLKTKTEEFEVRLTSNLQKIRVRERELENRLELIKMESSAVVRNKDETILDHKRQIDQLSGEIENFRTKTQELNRQIEDKQEMLRRTVKALRLALNLLEGNSDELDLKKKAK